MIRETIVPVYTELVLKNMHDQHCDVMTFIIQPCPAGSPSFRGVQCTATNDIEFEGTLHTWLPFTIQCKFGDLIIRIMNLAFIEICKIIL